MPTMLLTKRWTAAAAGGSEKCGCRRRNTVLSCPIPRRAQGAQFSRRSGSLAAADQPVVAAAAAAGGEGEDEGAVDQYEDLPDVDVAAYAEPPFDGEGRPQCRPNRCRCCRSTLPHWQLPAWPLHHLIMCAWFLLVCCALSRGERAGAAAHGSRSRAVRC